jgi:hypothetical protein
MPLEKSIFSPKKAFFEKHSASSKSEKGRNPQPSVYARPSTDAAAVVCVRFDELRLGWLGRSPRTSESFVAGVTSMTLFLKSKSIPDPSEDSSKAIDLQGTLT